MIQIQIKMAQPKSINDLEKRGLKPGDTVWPHREAIKRLEPPGDRGARWRQEFLEKGPAVVIRHEVSGQITLGRETEFRGTFMTTEVDPNVNLFCEGQMGIFRRRKEEM